MNEATLHFAALHADDDVRQLALQGTSEAGVDMPSALQQIAGRQTARQKLPTWAATDGIVYPPHLNMEQCSSELTARYKACVAATAGKSAAAADTENDSKTGGSTFVDLTGGLGVDFYWMSQSFTRRIYAEQSDELCRLARNNFQALQHDCDVVCASAEEYVARMEHADMVFIDPARRDQHGARTYGISDCTPDVLALLPMLAGKAATVVLKLSPMLDWHKAASDVSGTCEVHIVSVRGECKELLLVVKPGADAPDSSSLRLTCANIMADGTAETFVAMGETPLAYGVAELSCREKKLSYGDNFVTCRDNFLSYGDNFVTCRDNFVTHTDNFPNDADGESTELLFLFEPNASVMKGGCFRALEQCFGVSQLAAGSHLFLSGSPLRGFPGRAFRVVATCSLNKKDLRAAMAKAGSGEPLTAANISVRNFPLSADALRRRLRLRDGGDTYIFGTTLHDGSHRLFICRKIG